MTGHHDDPEALNALSIELVSVSIFKLFYKWCNCNNLFTTQPVTNMAPGITGFFERAKPFPNLIHFPGLYPKSQVETILYIGNQKKKLVPWGPWDDSHSFQNPKSVPLVPEAIINEEQEDIINVKLINLAYGRSGDKGDVSNIGI
jgi:hypothetical protein